MIIHQECVLSRKRVACLGAWLVVSGMLLLPGRGIAQIVTLTDGGSTATVNLGSSAGMNSWDVNEQNQLNQQWFWYSIGGGVAQPINTIVNTPGGGLTYSQDGYNNFLDATYSNSQLSIEIQYTLQGGGVGSGSADITESIMIVNNSSTSSLLNLNFYEYSYFNLLQSGHNSVQIFPDTANGGYYYVRQTSGSTAIQEGITSPNANYAEAGFVGGSDTLNNITTTPGYNLDGTTMAGPGNVSWAFEWTQTIGPSGELDIFKDKSLSIQMVPEPGSIALAVLGGLCLMGWTVRRRHSAS